MRHVSRRSIGLGAATLLMVALLFIIMPGQAPARMQGTPQSNLPGAQSFNTYLSDLSFSTQPDGAAATYFVAGTTQIYARFTYTNVPLETRLHRDWYRDGQLFVQREEPWNPAWGSSGYLNSISIYDFTEGLTPGNYYVVIYLTPAGAYPAGSVVGAFTIAGVPPTIIPPTRNASFSDLTVSISAAGAAMSSFPAATPVMYARWNYANIPIGAMMYRDWYLNGQLYKRVQEPWSANWGSSGRLTHIALYDYQFGLPSGNWQLVVYLRDNSSVRAQVSWTIEFGGGVGEQLFANLTFSDTASGPASYYFPRGTTQIFARWDFQNILPQATVRRTWYRNGVEWLKREEPWRYPVNGRVTDVSIYDFQFGLPPGDYYVVIETVGIAGTSVAGGFTIQ